MFVHVQHICITSDWICTRIGLDLHKKTIGYCVKDASGKVHQQGKIGVTRWELDTWLKTLPQPWTAAMEATIFSGWIYDHLKPHAAAVKVAHPLMLRAIAASKKKNDQIDAGKLADCLRCDFLPECYIDGDSREEANAAVSPSPGTASGAAEESCIKLADGNRSELQQAAPAPSRVFSRAAGQQGCDRQEYPTASATESRLNHATTTHRMCIDPIAAT